MAAICWGAIAVFLVGVLLTFAQDVLFGLFGAGDSSASQAGAATWYALTQAVLSGLAAGVLVYLLLRRSTATWPWYALAGAGPGLLLIVGEILTRTAGARVLDLAGRVSELELTVQRMLSGARLNSGLIILFVGRDHGRHRGRPDAQAGRVRRRLGQAQASSSSSLTAYHSSS